MFLTILLHSLTNWERATKSCLHQLDALQNRVIRASLFLPNATTTNLLYFKFQILNLKDMIKMEFAKFMFRFKQKILSISFDNYSTLLILEKSTRQKAKRGYIIIHLIANLGENDLMIMSA